MDSWIGKIRWRRDRLPTPVFLDFPGGSAGKESAYNVGAWVQSLSWEDPLEKGKTTHSSILAWRIPWTVYSVELQSRMWATFIHVFTESVMPSNYLILCHLLLLQPSSLPSIRVFSKIFNTEKKTLSQKQHTFKIVQLMFVEVPWDWIPEYSCEPWMRLFVIWATEMRV